jgi:hypothetical protein
MVQRFALVGCLLLFLTSCVNAAEVKVGDTVLAYWAPANAYFIGTAVEKQGNGFLIVFEDGDNAVVDSTRIRENNIKVGTAVVARWTDGEYYPGTVAKVVGRAFYIHYDDGDKGWAPWSWIAVK